MRWCILIMCETVIQGDGPKLHPQIGENEKPEHGALGFACFVTDAQLGRIVAVGYK